MKGDSNPFNIFKNMPQFAENILREVSAGDWFDAAGLFDGKSQERWPLVDILETADGVVVTADLPGLKGSGDVSIELKGNSLYIEGEVSPETGPGMTIHRQERPRGKFSRMIIIPTSVDAKNVRAVYQRGILEVKLAKVTARESGTLNVDFIK